jgi:hypothetical protein
LFDRVSLMGMTSGEITFVLVLVAAVIYASASNDNVPPNPCEEAGTRDQGC